jgi:hypothetical protein
MPLIPFSSRLPLVDRVPCSVGPSHVSDISVAIETR